MKDLIPDTGLKVIDPGHTAALLLSLKMPKPSATSIFQVTFLEARS
jgi:hypothetical protein